MVLNFSCRNVLTEGAHSNKVKNFGVSGGFGWYHAKQKNSHETRSPGVSGFVPPHAKRPKYSAPRHKPTIPGLR